MCVQIQDRKLEDVKDLKKLISDIKDKKDNDLI